MALIKCPECKKKVSDQCENCPKCGYPIKENIEKKNSELSEVTIVSEVIGDSEKKVAQTKKPINKKALIAIIAVASVVLIVGGIVGYNALLPRINATRDFKAAVAIVEEKNKQLDSAIKESEDLILKKQPLLDESLISALEMAISDTKSVKESNFKTPSSVEEIIARTEELKKIDYTDALNSLSKKHNELVINAKRYQLVNHPTEAYIIQCLKTIPEIVNISAVTEDNDPNGNLNKPGGYTATVYFAHEKINLDKSIYGETLIEQGTDAGGGIEVYTCVEDAVKRRDYLATFDGGIFANGTHTVIGTVLVRTSNELTATQQKDLEAKLIAALTFLSEEDQKDAETPKEDTSTTEPPKQDETTTPSTSDTTPPETDPPTDNNNAAIVVAKSYINAYECAYPNALKDHMKANGYTDIQINYALNSGQLDWITDIKDIIWSYNFEAEEITVTNCVRCHKKFYGEYNSCQYLNCGGGVNWSYYYGYSRTDTINKLLALGFSKSDVDATMQDYQYGEFMDEIDFSDCIKVTGKLCEHFWNPATCKELSSCPYCGETKGGYADHEYYNKECIHCEKEEPWTAPQISCSSWVSLKELQDEAGYYIKTSGNTITIEDLNDDRVKFVLTGFPNMWQSGDTFELDCNGVTVHCQTDSESNYVYQNIKLKYSDLVAIGALS